MGTDARATEMLLNALVAVGALLKQGGVFRCSEEAKALGPARAGLLHTVHLWDTWSTLTACVRSGKAVLARSGRAFLRRAPAPLSPRCTRGPSDNAEETVAFRHRDAKRMLDVGGGSGAYSIAFAKACPALHRGIWTLARSCLLPRNTP